MIEVIEIEFVPIPPATQCIIEEALDTQGKDTCRDEQLAAGLRTLDRPSGFAVCVILMHMQLPFSSPSHNTMSLPMCCLLIVSFPLMVLGQQTSTSEASPERATLQALLTEVRQLRFALERSTLVVPRIQLAFQRFQLQQDRVDSLSKRLQDIHLRTLSAEDRKAKLILSAQQAEARISQEQDPRRRKVLELEGKAATMELEQQTQHEQQDQAQEIQLSRQLQTEQAKLNELSDQLNELDKKLQQDLPTPNSTVKP